jgi:hypothetical protein
MKEGSFADVDALAFVEHLAYLAVREHQYVGLLEKFDSEGVVAGFDAATRNYDKVVVE